MRLEKILYNRGFKPCLIRGRKQIRPFNISLCDYRSLLFGLHLPKSLAAFTLIEVLVGTLIFSTIIIGIYSVLNVTSIGWHNDVGMLGLQQQARQAIDGMTREVRQCNSMPIATCAARIDFGIPGLSGLISYYLENNQVIREYPAGTKKILASDIDSLAFCPFGSVLQIQLEARKTILKRDLSLVMTERVRLRNE